MQQVALQDLLPRAQSPASSKAHDAVVHCWGFGEHILSRAIFSEVSAAQLPLLYPWDSKESWCLVLIKAASNDPTLLSPAHVGQLDAACTIESSYSRPYQFEMITLIIPANSAEPVISDIEQLVAGRSSATLALAIYIDGLVSLLPNLTSEGASRVATMTRALVASYFAPMSVSCDLAEHISKPLLFERARRIVRQHMLSPDFGPEQLCQLLAVSRSKLYRLFESSGGVVNFINSERLNCAHEKLCDPLGVSMINKIGTEVGFYDHSTFSRAFKRKFGYSPSEARSKALTRSEKTTPFGNDLDKTSDDIESRVAS